MFSAHRSQCRYCTHSTSSVIQQIITNTRKPPCKQHRVNITQYNILNNHLNTFQTFQPNYGTLWAGFICHELMFLCILRWFLLPPDSQLFVVGCSDCFPIRMTFSKVSIYISWYRFLFIVFFRPCFYTNTRYVSSNWLICCCIFIRQITTPAYPNLDSPHIL